MSERVSVELVDAGALLRITFERDKGNVLTASLMRGIDSALAEHKHDGMLKLVVLEGQGRNFSYGASVEEHTRALAPEMLSSFHGLVRRIVRYPVPVAALVRGRCLGGAFELALACRFVFADASAVFACPEIKLGVFPPVLAALGPARLGQAWTDRLLLTGQEIDAETARRIGFVTEALSDFEQLSEWYRNHFGQFSAFSLRQATAALRVGSKLDEAVGETLTRIERIYLDRLLPSHDGNEGITAFMQKRQPDWRNA